MAVPAPCLVLGGPTAVGKTGILEQLAECLGQAVEVISADAFQVYRGLNIGTAKPDSALQSRIPHHLIDIRDPDQGFSVADFVQATRVLIPQITARGAVPVVCGGTVYYLKHLVSGLPETPPSDPAIRRRLEAELAESGVEPLLAELAAADPLSAARIHANDHYRLLRALEVWRGSGRPLSRYRTTGAGAGGPFVACALARPRDELVRRIGIRVDAMLAQGLAAEVRALLASGYGSGDPGMKAIGYQEFIAGGDFNEDTAAVREAIIIHSRQYAKHQMTFLRGIAGLSWIEAGEVKAAAAGIARLWRERRQAGSAQGNPVPSGPGD